jgi:hypothetical protein
VRRGAQQRYEAPVIAPTKPAVVMPMRFQGPDRRAGGHDAITTLWMPESEGESRHGGSADHFDRLACPRRERICTSSSGARFLQYGGSDHAR